MVTIKELKEIIKGLPDDMRVTGIDSVGEEIYPLFYVTDYKADGLDDDDVFCISLD